MAELPGTATISRYLGLVSFALGLIAVVAKGRHRALNGFFLFAALFVLLAGTSSFWSLDPEFTLLRSWAYVRLLAMAWLIWEIAQTVPRHRGLMQAYVLGGFFPIIGTIRNYLRGESWYGRVEFGYLERYGVAGFNVNDLALIVALGIPMAWYLTINNKHNLVTWINYLYTPAAALTVLLTASRGSALATAVALLTVPLTLPKSKLRHTITIGVLMAAVYFVTRSISLQFSFSRLQAISHILSGEVTDRSSIWRAGFEVFQQYPFLGVGAGAYRRIDPLGTVAHNSFLSVAVELGLVGLVLFLAMLLSCLLTSSIKHKPRLEQTLWILLFLTWGLGAFVLSWEHAAPTWLLFGLSTTWAGIAENQEIHLAQPAGQQYRASNL